MKDFLHWFRFPVFWLSATFVLISFIFPVSSQAQFYNGYQMEFGRSRVQYKEFFWSYYKFNRLDTYFYLNGKELAVHTAKYASAELGRLENELDTYLEGKIQFIIFNNLTELKQSNIGLSANEQYNIGGVTHILGNKIVIYFDGSIINFEKQIRKGIVHVLLSNAIFGTNIGSQVMNTVLQGYPQWYTKGLIAYLSEEWNTDIDNRVRNMIFSGRFNSFNQLTIDEDYVTDAGHSFWRFIAQKYGKANVPNIINMTQVSRSIETGFQYVLGVSLKSLFDEWFMFYGSIYREEDADAYMPDEGFCLTGKRVLKRFKARRKYSELQISPDGAYAAFVTNETGKYKLWLRDMQTGKLKKLFTGGYKLDEKIDYTYPLITWHPTGSVLAMIIEKKGLVWLYFYDVDEHRWTNQNIFGFEKIVGLSYSGDGRNLVFSAVQKGQSDLFTFNIPSGSYQQLTNDIYDDMYPKFIQNSSKIIFSSNRVSDTLKYGDNTIPKDLPETYDVFVYNFNSHSPLLRRVTNTPLANETQPMEYGRGYISYLSDGNGIYNEYVGKLDSAVAFVDTTVHYRYFTRSFPITNYSRNISEHNITPRAGMKSWIINRDLYDYLYIDNLLLAKNLEGEELINTPYMDELIASARPVKIIIPEETTLPDQEDIKLRPKERQRKSFRSVMKNDVDINNPGIDTKPDPNKIDINNYQLDKQGIVNINMPDSVNYVEGRFKPKKKDKKDGFFIPKQRNYRVEFSVSQLVTQVDFSYLNQSYQPFSVSLNPSNNANVPGFDINPNYSSPGLSPTFKIGVSDLMEDYRIIGGIRLSLDLINKEFFVNFANLKKRLDKEFIFQRRTIEQPIVSAYVSRQYTNEGFFVLTYPLNRVLRLRGTVLFRNEKYVFAGPDEYSIRYPNVNYNWGGAKGQLIYDDTKNIGLNLYEGSRFMVFAEYNQMIEELDRNLLVFGFDFRNYQRLHRQFIWANRIAGSTNFGTDKLLYYMGGTDSWMLPSFDQDTPLDYDQNWVYQALATNMRGFNQNARNGNNFLVINSEFRLPLFRYLLNRPIKSEFINSFQVVAFGDLGTAWSGWNPWDEENVLYTRYVESGPLRIRVQYEKDPIIGGVGLGARAKLLGYFIKGDMAWGIEDGKIKSTPMFYLSLSLDF